MEVFLPDPESGVVRDLRSARPIAEQASLGSRGSQLSTSRQQKVPGFLLFLQGLLDSLVFTRIDSIVISLLRPFLDLQKWEGVIV